MDLVVCDWFWLVKCGCCLCLHFTTTDSSICRTSSNLPLFSVVLTGGPCYSLKCSSTQGWEGGGVEKMVECVRQYCASPFSYCIGCDEWIAPDCTSCTYIHTYVVVLYSLWEFGHTTWLLSATSGTFRLLTLSMYVSHSPSHPHTLMHLPHTSHSPSQSTVPPLFSSYHNPLPSPRRAAKHPLHVKAILQMRDKVTVTDPVRSSLHRSAAYTLDCRCCAVYVCGVRTLVHYKCSMWHGICIDSTPHFKQVWSIVSV